MENTYRRFDISDVEWKLIKPYLTGQPGRRGGIVKNDRKFINAVVWILKTGSSREIYRWIMANGGQFIKDLFDGNEKDVEKII